MSTTDNLRTTVLHDWHRRAGAKMVPFGGFDMPVQYGSILNEHLATRRNAGLFDISHMGRFLFSGDAVPFLQYMLTNNVNALREPGMAHYTLIPDDAGGAVDDAYLYRTGTGDYMLVVNAANRDKDWAHLSAFFSRFPRLKARDASEEIAMLALQGPESEKIVAELLTHPGSAGRLPENEKNRLSRARIDGIDLVISRTGYTGEPVGFELFPPTSEAVRLWEAILETGSKFGVATVGLGARDTLRLEAGYPLYGHEFGDGPDGKPIPIFSFPLARPAVRFDEGKGDFIGRAPLHAQYLEVGELLRGGAPKPIEERVVPRFFWPLAVLNPEHTGPSNNPPRSGNEIRRHGNLVGWVTSGSTVPSWSFDGAGLLTRQIEDQEKRAIGLAYVDSSIVPGEFGTYVELVKPNAPRPVPALLVRANLRLAPPYARPVIHPEDSRKVQPFWSRDGEGIMKTLVTTAAGVTRTRQRLQVNLIPSEQTPSLLVRLLSILDPAGRYAEHNRLEALGKNAQDIYHYQGTGFTRHVEEEVQALFKGFLGCSEVEARPISGQMANHCVFRGMVDYTNRFRKEEPLRLGYVMMNALRNGGHLSAQMLGSLHNHVSYDPQTGKAAVIAFPIRKDNPYQIDLEATSELIDRYRPQLIVLGKSMVLHPEPVREISQLVHGLGTIVMYDMAHVLGLAGPHFQEPFKDGAHIVTGSTHKTFFGTQRGIIASNMSEDTELWPLWDRIVAAAFPGSTSNHHPGTLLGLLGSCLEMLSFGDAYQKQVISNAKAFAKALKDAGLAVEGDPAIGYTETHQVVVRVGNGPETADRLERNNVVVNSQTLPTDASVSAASGIRIGVQEMTRFGMKERDFQELAGILAEIVRGGDLADEVSRFRGRFTQMQYCFSGETARSMTKELIEVLGV
jgi:aminomethyltransferase